mgnify:CR=1 FL=1
MPPHRRRTRATRRSEHRCLRLCDAILTNRPPLLVDPSRKARLNTNRKQLQDLLATAVAQDVVIVLGELIGATLATPLPIRIRHVVVFHAHTHLPDEYYPNNTPINLPCQSVPCPMIDIHNIYDILYIFPFISKELRSSQCKDSRSHGYSPTSPPTHS